MSCDVVDKLHKAKICEELESIRRELERITRELELMRAEISGLRLELRRAIDKYTRFWKVMWLIFLITFIGFFTIRYLIL